MKARLLEAFMKCIKLMKIALMGAHRKLKAKKKFHWI